MLTHRNYHQQNLCLVHLTACQVFQRLTDFSSALPSVVSNTSVIVPAMPTSVAALSSVAPPPITSAEDSSTEVILESSSNTDSDDDDEDDDDRVTPQGVIQSLNELHQLVVEQQQT